MMMLGGGWVCCAFWSSGRYANQYFRLLKCPVSGQFSADFREKKAGHVGSQNEPSINQHQNETYHSSPSFHSDSLLASAHFD